MWVLLGAHTLCAWEPSVRSFLLALCLPSGNLRMATGLVSLERPGLACPVELQPHGPTPQRHLFCPHQEGSQTYSPTRWLHHSPSMPPAASEGDARERTQQRREGIRGLEQEGVTFFLKGKNEASLLTALLTLSAECFSPQISQGS